MLANISCFSLYQASWVIYFMICWSFSEFLFSQALSSNTSGVKMWLYSQKRLRDTTLTPHWSQKWHGNRCLMKFLQHLERLARDKIYRATSSHQKYILIPNVLFSNHGIMYNILRTVSKFICTILIHLHIILIVSIAANQRITQSASSVFKPTDLLRVEFPNSAFGNFTAVMVAWGRPAGGSWTGRFGPRSASTSADLDGFRMSSAYLFDM